MIHELSRGQFFVGLWSHRAIPWQYTSEVSDQVNQIVIRIKLVNPYLLSQDALLRITKSTTQAMTLFRLIREVSRTASLTAELIMWNISHGEIPTIIASAKAQPKTRESWVAIFLERPSVASVIHFVKQKYLWNCKHYMLFQITIATLVSILLF